MPSPHQQLLYISRIILHCHHYKYPRNYFRIVCVQQNCKLLLLPVKIQHLLAHTLHERLTQKNGGYFGARKGSQEFYLFSGLCVLDLLNSSSNYKTNIIWDELYCNCRTYCEQNALKQGIPARAKCTPLCHFATNFSVQRIVRNIHTRIKIFLFHVYSDKFNTCYDTNKI